MDHILVALQSLAIAQLGDDSPKLKFDVDLLMSCAPDDGALAHRFIAANTQYVYERLDKWVWQVKLRGIGRRYIEANAAYKQVCLLCGFDRFYVTSVISRQTDIFETNDDPLMFGNTSEAITDHMIKCQVCGHRGLA